MGHKKKRFSGFRSRKTKNKGKKVVSSVTIWLCVVLVNSLKKNEINCKTHA